MQKALSSPLIIEGQGSTSGSQVGFLVTGLSGKIIDSAIYNMGDFGLHVGSSLLYLEEVNIGVEAPNYDDDISHSGNTGNGPAMVFGRDVKLGGTYGDVLIVATDPVIKHNFEFENFNKVLGAHKRWYSGGTIEKVAVSGENPAKKISDDVIKISPNNSNFQFVADNAEEIFCHEFEATTDSKSYKYWVYNDMGVTLNDTTAKDDIWLELEYVKIHDDDTEEYVIKKVESDEIDLADETWGYLEVTGIAPAVASKVRIKCYCRAYAAATADIFIDPAVVIS